MDLDEERKAFDDWHFLDWKLNCAVTDTVEYARNIYDRIYKPTNYDQIYVREQSFKVWQAAKAHEAEKLKGKVVVPVEPTQAMIDAVRSEHEGEPYLPYSLYKSFSKAATVEAARGGNE